ncbi:MAG: hypothetical protein IJP44_05450 [Bacteroidales bacterium]|nr:hypothetical protein [Bacteroidales bacterium]
MKKSRIVMGATALTMAAVAIIACSKEKTAQNETITEQQPKNPNDYTLAEMIEVMTWEEGKAFFENQTVKDYTYVCEKVLNDCDLIWKAQGSSYSIQWRWLKPNGECDNVLYGICSGRKSDTTFRCENARGFFEDDKFVIVPTTTENGFSADGYLAVGGPVVMENDTIVISEGIYAAYYDEDSGKYAAVAVDFETIH